MKFRPNTATFAESIRNLVTIPATKGGLIEAIQNHFGITLEPDVIDVTWVSYDPRTHWDSHVVTAHNYVYGFTNCPLITVKESS